MTTPAASRPISLLLRCAVPLLIAGVALAAAAPAAPAAAGPAAVPVDLVGDSLADGLPLAGDSNSSTVDKNAALGFGAASISVFLFGSNYVPLKRFDSGDGMFFQWLLCSFIFLTGVVVSAIKGFAEFHPLAMLGGFFWATGNITVVPVVKMIGLAQGLLLWSGSNLLMGYFSGRYGWFGITPTPPNDEALSSAGVALCCVSLVFYLFIKPSVDKESAAPSSGAGGSASEAVSGYLPEYLVEVDDDDYTLSRSTTANYSHNSALVSSSTALLSVVDGINGDGIARDASSRLPASGAAAGVALRRGFSSKSHLAKHVASSGGAPQQPEPADTSSSWVDRLTPAQRNIAGRVLAVMAGCCYGVNFLPVVYVQNNYEGASQEGLDYVFAHFTGIYATSSVYFVLYCIYMKNKPQVFNELILPSLVSGSMWAVSQSMWFLANQNLSQTISFPIIATGPGVVSSIIGVVFFGEIRGSRNFAFLSGAFAFAFAGVILTALSN